MNLVIVESPTKAKTITKFLGKDYKVESSFGHVRDLPKKKMGIDIKNNFEPEYEVSAEHKKKVTHLKSLADKAEKIILATDEDREGEAISWHLVEALKLGKKNIGRIVFHEITKDAILESLKHERTIDMNLVDAQQARRILDRLVGYELSPFLWKKVAKGLSAGRVQSVAVRLVVEREKEIRAFKSDEYWSIVLDLVTHNSQLITSSLHKINGKSLDKLYIKNQDEADGILAELKKAEYVVARVDKKQSKKSAPTPFTTSTLQQAANRMLGFSAKQTMMVAQQLYEGLDLGGESGGLITYMRTDSLNLSDKFIGEAKSYLEATLGDQYILKTPRKFKNKSKNAQEAHEAIRPTEASLHPDQLKDKLNSNQYRLYRLIWQRAMASQMPDAILDATTIDIDTGKTDKTYTFRATGQTMRFEGYLKIYPEKTAELELPEIEQGESLEMKEIKPEQHFTKPPARYSDAGLVKEMEKYGIGRPSTYAPTLATIEARNYVARDENKKLYPTDIAFVVIDLLVQHFQDIVNYEFTANMEKNLDEIAEGKRDWQPVIGEFYNPFHENLTNKNKEIKKEDVMPEEQSEEKCDKCGAPMIIKTGRYGKFLACSGYPECKNIKGMPGTEKPGVSEEKKEELKKLEDKYQNEKCEKCGSPMAIKNGRYGAFLACTAYPKCKNIKNIQENTGASTSGGENSLNMPCPVCGKGKIVQKRSKRGFFYGCDQYPECKTAFWDEPTGTKCPQCEAPMVKNKFGKVKCSSKECGYQE